MSILLIVIFVVIVCYRAIIGFIPIADDVKITQGEERTDTVLCYQKPGSDTLMLINLSHQEYDYYFDEYPADLLEKYGMLPGDFAGITYQAEYSVGGEDGHHAYIKILNDAVQLMPSEALADRTYQTMHREFNQYRTATSYPIVIYQQDYADFVIIPAGEHYLLFTPDSDAPMQFDDYRKITKEIEINGKTRFLHAWVLCSHKLSDEKIAEALYQGNITDNPDLFFVGYDTEYPFSFTANGYEQPGLYQVRSQFYPSDTSIEPYAFHLQADQISNPDALNMLPKDIQQEIFTNWKSSDDVIIFGGNCSENTFLTFDDDNRLTAMSEQTEQSGYAVFFVESGLFENICSGIEGE